MSYRYSVASYNGQNPPVWELPLFTCVTVLHSYSGACYTGQKPIIWELPFWGMIVTRFNKIAIQGTPQTAVDKEAICLSSLLILL